MAIKHLSGNRVTALSTDLVGDKDITWSTSANVTVSGGQVTKNSGGTAYNAGTSSTETSDKITFTNFTEGNYNTWAGINTGSGSPPLGFTGIFWRQAGTSDMRIMSDTTALKTLTNTISSSDTYEIRNVSGTAKFYKNGTEQTGFTNPSYPSGVINTIIYQENTGVKGTLESPRLGTTDATTSIDDDFSSDNFTNVGGQSGWGVSSNSMAWTTYRGTPVQGEYIALPSTFSGNFVVRFKLTPTTVAYAGTEEYLWVGLTNSNSCNSATSQNQAGFYFHNYSSSDSKYQVTYKTNGGLFSGAVATSINFSSTAYWVEIIKDGDSVKLTLYSDEYVTAVSGGTATSTAGGATDSYTHFVLTGMYHGSSSGGGSSLGTIDDLKIYKDITSAASTDNAVTVPNGSVAEETDTGKHKMWNSTTSAWVEVA